VHLHPLRSRSSHSFSLLFVHLDSPAAPLEHDAADAYPNKDFGLLLTGLPRLRKTWTRMPMDECFDFHFYQQGLVRSYVAAWENSGMAVVSMVSVILCFLSPAFWLISWWMPDLGLPVVGHFLIAYKPFLAILLRFCLFLQNHWRMAVFHSHCPSVRVQ
jgi:hypothetical protein